MAEGAHGYSDLIPPGCARIGAELVKWRASEVGAKIEFYTHTKLGAPDGRFKVQGSRRVISHLDVGLGALNWWHGVHMKWTTNPRSAVCSLCSNRVLQYVALVMLDLLLDLVGEGRD